MHTGDPSLPVAIERAVEQGVGMKIFDLADYCTFLCRPVEILRLTCLTCYTTAPGK